MSCCLFFPLETKGMISFSLPLAMLPHRYDSLFDAVHNFSPITNFNRYECKKYKRKFTHGREDGGIGSLAYDAAACYCPASWSRLFPASGFDIIKTAIDSTTTAHISSKCLPWNKNILFLALFPFLNCVWGHQGEGYQNLPVCCSACLTRVLEQRQRGKGRGRGRQFSGRKR